ncbi:hypothetical protein FNO01nite_22340 [Flavobacterium noncentrifugens]|uniref:Lipoprotein n=1 Tax=Flavobacterium noncentrifugens TaxID=1128970 RepID=A0A1G9ARU7_9FLAO|nr:hypothetical protein [Flavobacterium noncentrifugens]GEP51562.1 hypothetical protein FNO01nite_22340 [Flavobacterium noncentrifugens]SDK30036.1 hypothetical protein SAMN04487935_3026 [Flavobacterium noncentrifugens]
MLEKKRPILFLLAIITYSCGCVQTSLTEGELQWVSSYKKGEQIVFKSDRGNVDTLVVIDKIESFTNPDCNRFGVGKTQQNFVTVKLKPKACKKRSYCDILIDIRKEKEDEEAYLFLRVYGLEYAFGHGAENDTLNLQKEKKFGSVYYFQEGINCKGYGLNHPKSFRYNKNNGLISYEKKDGELFELYKKIE